MDWLKQLTHLESARLGDLRGRIPSLSDNERREFNDLAKRALQWLNYRRGWGSNTTPAEGVSCSHWGIHSPLGIPVNYSQNIPLSEA